MTEIIFYFEEYLFTFYADVHLPSDNANTITISSRK